MISVGPLLLLWAWLWWCDLTKWRHSCHMDMAMTSLCGHAVAQIIAPLSCRENGEKQVNVWGMSLGACYCLVFGGLLLKSFLRVFVIRTAAWNCVLLRQNQLYVCCLWICLISSSGLFEILKLGFIGADICIFGQYDCRLEQAPSAAGNDTTYYLLKYTCL